METLVDWCRDVSGGSLDGVTISGGEPFDQPEGLLVLLKQLHGWRSEVAGSLDILVYSGYSGLVVKRNFGEHLGYVDAVVAGPFKESAGGDKPYCGSDNQQIVICSPLAESRYGPEQLRDWKSGMQVAADEEGIWMIGIPRPGDLNRLESSCLTRGLVLKQVSWRS